MAFYGSSADSLAGSSLGVCRGKLDSLSTWVDDPPTNPCGVVQLDTILERVEAISGVTAHDLYSAELLRLLRQCRASWVRAAPQDRAQLVAACRHVVVSWYEALASSGAR